MVNKLSYFYEFLPISTKILSKIHYSPQKMAQTLIIPRKNVIIGLFLLDC